MKDAQTEIKTTVTVNTTDLSANANADKDALRDADKIRKKRDGRTNGVYVSEALQEELAQAAITTG